MKKISILSLAVLLAAGTGFAGRSLSVGKINVDDSRQQLNVPLFADKVLGKDRLQKASKKVTVSPDEVSGVYRWSKLSLIRNSEESRSLDVNLVDQASGLVEITGWHPDYDVKVLGVVDFQEGTLEIANNQIVGEDEYGPLYFYLKPVDLNTGQILEGVAEEESTVGYFTGKGFEFYPYDVWTLGDPAYEDGELFMTYLNEIIAYDEVEEGQWESIGLCTIEDAWITPGFRFDNGTEEGVQIDPAEVPFTAELQRSVDNENRYRVWRPYHSEDWILVDYNESAYNGQIVFDITDPEHVVVEAGYFAGFGEPGEEFCVFGLLGFQIYSFGLNWDPEYLPSVISFMEEYGQPFDTFADNVLSVNWAVFDTSLTCRSAYSWNGDYHVSKITFPDSSAVSNVEVENAPVKYYNLQGVEVANPAVGQIVICRQGDKATKKIIK